MINTRLNRTVVLRALKTAHAAELAKNTGNSSWEAHNIQEQITFLEGEFPNASGMLQVVGGEWLGNIREWMKCKAINGCDVTWGSETPLILRSPLTVAELERIAAKAASSCAAESLGMKQAPHFAELLPKVRTFRVKAKSLKMMGREFGGLELTLARIIDNPNPLMLNQPDGGYVYMDYADVEEIFTEAKEKAEYNYSDLVRVAWLEEVIAARKGHRKFLLVLDLNPGNNVWEEITEQQLLSWLSREGSTDIPKLITAERLFFVKANIPSMKETDHV